ncbi:unnamed protein product, partial [Ectocarpus sp. 6 AP-2014]
PTQAVTPSPDDVTTDPAADTGDSDNDSAEDLWTNEMLIAVVSTVASAMFLGLVKILWDRRPRLAVIEAPVGYPNRSICQNCPEPVG